MGSLARVALQRHRILVRGMKSVTNEEEHRGLTKALRVILEEPHKALYIQKVNIEVWDPHDAYFEDDPMWKADTMTALEHIVGRGLEGLFKSLLTGEQDSSDSRQMDTMLAHTSMGDEGLSIGLLCMLMPNVIELRIEAPWDNWAFMSMILRLENRIASFQRCFTTLRSIEIKAQRDLDIAFSVLLMCAQIPSVEELVGCYLNQSSIDNTLQPFASNVKYLHLSQCTLSDHAIAFLLCGMNQLKRFDYYHYALADEDHYRPSPWNIREVLQRTAPATLETLVVIGLQATVPAMESPYIGSLRAFESLHDVTIELDMLSGAHYDLAIEDFGLITHMPPSIREVRFEFTRSQDAEVRAMLDVLLGQTSSPLHNLTRLRISGLEVDCANALADGGYTNRLADLGITLEFENLID